MKKILVVLATVVCSGLLAFGQSAGSNPYGQSDSTQQSASANSTTVDGCLSGSNGSYLIKDKSTGATYNLTGNTSKLGNHVGHEVQVTGIASNAPSGVNSSASQTSMGNASAISGQASLRVTSFKHVASSCTSGQ